MTHRLLGMFFWLSAGTPCKTTGPRRRNLSIPDDPSWDETIGREVYLWSTTSACPVMLVVTQGHGNVCFITCLGG